MRALGPFLTLICGVLVLVGLFLPWFQVTETSLVDGQFISLTLGASGWNFIHHGGGGFGDLYGYLLSMVFSPAAEWLVLVGSILMIVSAMVAFSTYLLTKQLKLTAIFLGVIASVGALLAIIGTLKYIIGDMDVLSLCPLGRNVTGKGVYISAVFAFLGIICAVTTFLQARARFDVIEEPDTIERSCDIASPSVGASGSVREYYEKKAAAFEKESTPVEDKTTMAAIPSMPKMPPISAAAAPLPPLPAIIDDAAAQECFIQAGEFEAAGERDKAIEQYTKAVHLNAKHTTAYFKRGMLLMEMGFKPAAVADFRRVIDIADNPELTDIAKANIVKLG